MAETERPAAVRVRPGATLGLADVDYKSLVAKIRKGFPYRTYVLFQRESRLDEVAIRRVMQVPDRTLARRKAAKAFKPDESERLLRLSRVFEGAIELFEGDREAAKRWLERPARALGGVTPLEAAETEIGAQEVGNLIGRLEHGVFT